MEINFSRHWALMKGCSPTVRAKRAQPGYTLVELLVGVTLGSVVLASLGGVLLISEVKVAAKIQRNLDAKDAANRAIDLIRREAASARYFRRSGFGDPSSCSSSPIVFEHFDGATTCIKSVPITSSLLDAQYQKAFAGPCLLVRVGVPYKPDGELNTSAPPIVQPLLDGLALVGGSCSANYTSNNSASNGLSAAMAPFGNNFFNAIAGMTINMANGSVYKFSALVPSIHGYAGNDFWNDGNSCSTINDYGCGPVSESVYHFKPEDSSTSAVVDPKTGSKENVFYFKYPFSQYSLSKDATSGDCSYAECHVIGPDKAVQLKEVDALIFPDKEVRPPS